MTARSLSTQSEIARQGCAHGFFRPRGLGEGHVPRGTRWRIGWSLSGARAAEEGGAGAGGWCPGQTGVGSDEVEGGGREDVFKAGPAQADVATSAQTAAA